MDVQQLKHERDKLNDETKKLVEESRESTQRVKKLRLQLKESKQKRDSENDLVKEFKEKRDEVNGKIKAKLAELNRFQEELNKLDTASGVRPHEAKRELEQLEWKVQTDVLNVKQEEKIAKRIDELEKLCAANSDFIEKRKLLRKLKGELDELRKEAQAFHSVMMQHAKESESHHEEVKKTYSQIKKIEPDFKQVRNKIISAKKEADEAHKLYLDKYKEIKGEEQVEHEASQKKRVRKMRAEADDLMKAFMEGKKLTTEELRIIQGYGGNE